LFVALPEVAGTPDDGVAGVAAPGALPPPTAAKATNAVSTRQQYAKIMAHLRASSSALRRWDSVGVEHLQLHLLAGGVLTLHAWGSSSARVLSMVTPPRDEESPLSAAQRHCGLVRTTLASCEQHDDGGADTLPLM